MSPAPAPRPPLKLPTPAVQPVLARPRRPPLRLGGFVGQRIERNQEGWLLPAPEANPALLEMFRQRERQPRQLVMPWAGEFAGKYLTAAVPALRMVEGARLRPLLADFVRELIASQAEDGYLGPHPRDQRFTGTGMWRQRELWDVWGHYHCLLGLLAWHDESGDQAALAACCRAAELLCRFFMDAGRRLSELIAAEKDMAVIHAFLLLHRRTGQPRYREMAHYILRDWENPGGGDYLRQALAGVPFHQMPRRRWESLHDVQALAELYWLTGKQDYRRAFEAIWWSILEGDRRVTGAFSTNEGAVGDPYAAGPIETCCTVAWLALSLDMLRLTGAARVADEIEFSTLNAMLAAQHPSGRWWTYDTPEEGVRLASAHEIVFHSAPGTPEINCCAVNGPRSLAMLAEWAVMLAEDGPVVNYYGPGTIAVELPSGQPLSLRQEGDYLRTGQVRLELGLAAPDDFALQLRIPLWSPGARLAVNQEAWRQVAPGYHRLARRWRPGDQIRLSLDPSPHVWVGQGRRAGQAALYHGPLLLAYDRRFNRLDPDQLPVLDLTSLQLEALELEGRQPPWLAFRVRLEQDEDLILCDFASAGAAGTPYRVWLPARGLAPRGSERPQPRWMQLTGGGEP